MEDLKKTKEFLSLGSGYGYGYGDGDGDGSGSGYGSGYGYGDGSGDGYGYGYGYGSGSGSGYGYGYGSGSGSGDGYGYGYGSGSGDGYGYGYGSGSGDGYGDGIKSVNGETVWMVDCVQTLIDKVRGNVAKGRILMGDLTTKPCYIVKGNNLFAHGDTLREAMSALTDKMFEDMPEEERIEAFVKEHEGNTPYPNTDLFEWHHNLTGSCLAGRNAFVQNHGLSLEGSTTVEDFIKLTENDYGGRTIRKLKVHYGMEG